MNELFAGLPGFDNGRARVSSTFDGIILLGRDRRGLEGVGNGMNRSESEGDGWRNRARFDNDGPFALRCSGAILILDSRNRARGVSLSRRDRAWLPVRCRVLCLKSPIGEVPIEIQGVLCVQLIVERVEAKSLLDIPMH